MTSKPALVISGFLGAGKTTLLNQIMQANPDLRLALIINEFGDIGLDSSLLKTPGEFVEMNNGCLCCALNEDLVLTLEKLKIRDDYDAIIIETSGIADPLTIAWTFLRPQFESKFALHGIITVVDASSFFKQQDKTILEEQIRSANLLYLSKTSDTSQHEFQRVCEYIQTINSGALLILDETLNWVQPLLLNEQQIFLKEPKHQNHQGSYTSTSENLEGKQTTLEEMEDLFESFPKNTLRAKAIFFDSIKEKYFAIHLVCGRITFEPLLQKPTVLACVTISTNQK